MTNFTTLIPALFLSTTFTLMPAMSKPTNQGTREPTVQLQPNEDIYDAFKRMDPDYKAINESSHEWSDKQHAEVMDMFGGYVQYFHANNWGGFTQAKEYIRSHNAALADALEKKDFEAYMRTEAELMIRFRLAIAEDVDRVNEQLEFIYNEIPELNERLEEIQAELEGE